MSINRVIVTGNITRDAEYRETASGVGIVSFGIAVNDRRKNGQTGEWEDYANFFNVTRFGSQKLAAALTKGTRIGIDGKLHYHSWEQDGQKRSVVDITATEIEFLGGNRNNDNGSSDVPAPAAQPSAVAAQDSLYDEDIPF